VTAGDARALADAILAHRNAQMSTQPAPKCHRQQVNRIDATAIGRQFIEMIEQRLGNQ